MCAERDAPVVERVAMPGHVHLLVWFDPRYDIHRPAEQIEGRSSRLLCQEFGHPRSRLPTLWINS